MFLLSNFNIEKVLKMPFLTFTNFNIKFLYKKPIWKSYTTAKALPTINYVKIINKKKFTKAILDKNVETFIIHVTFFNLNLMLNYPA